MASLSNVVDENSVWAEQDRHTTRTYRYDVSHLLTAGASITHAAWAVQAPPGAEPVEIVSESFLADAVMVQLKGGTPKKWYGVTVTFRSSDGDEQTFTLRLFVKEDVEAGLLMGSALFANKFVAINRLRNDRLLGVAKGALPNTKISSDYLWEKILAAEADAAHQLRVELQPTRFFPLQPSVDVVAALGDMPWKVDAAYDYDPSMFIGERWGFTQIRSKPLISIDLMTVNYPAQDQPILTVPPEWIRFDPRSAQVNLVPSGVAPNTAFATSLLGGLIGADRLPFSLHITYTAGLTDAARNYPDLVDVVMKMATLRILEDAFLPQSGSISADGLSRSLSRDMGKYQEAVDAKLFGGKGANMGLRSLIHGITLGVL